MRPTKAKYTEKGQKAKTGVYCRGAGKMKLQFETEKRALNAIKFNAGNKTFKANRAYYCKSCYCWHITSSKGTAHTADFMNAVKEEFKEFLK